MTEAVILVVEDESIVARSIKDKLSELGYEVPAIATSGKEAIQKAKEIRPDLILMDIQLKGQTDGVEAAQEIHTSFGIPVVYLTAYTDEETLQRAKLAEPLGYVLKPFALAELHSTIEMALFKHAADTKIRRYAAQLEVINQVAQQELAERKRAEVELEKSLSLLSGTLESTADGILVVDRDGQVTSFNRKFVEMWRIPESLLASRNSDQLLSFVAGPAGQLAEPDAFLSKVRQLHTDPEAESFDVLEFKGGRIFERYSQPQRIAGKSVGRVWSFRDVTERVRAERALQDSEERFRALFEYAPDAYYLNDLRGNFVDGNRAAEELVGYKRDELIGKSFLRLGLLPPLQIPKAAALLARNVLGQPTGPDEFTLNRPDGSQVSVEIRTFPVKIGGEALVLGIARDITERLRAEEDMVQRNRELAALNAIAAVVSQSLDLDEILNAGLDKALELMHLTVGGIYLTDPSHRELSLIVHRGVSMTFVGEMDSITIDEETLGAITTESKLQRFVFSIAAVIRNQATLTKIVSAMKKEGLSLTSAVLVLLQTKEQILGLMIVASRMPRQFTKAELQLLTSIGQQIAIAVENARLYRAAQQELAERKRTEAALRRLKEFNEGIVQSVNEGIVVENAEGNLTFVNPTAAAWLGYSPSELLGQHWTIIVPPDQRPIVQEANKRRMRGQADRYEVQLVGKDGARVPVLVSGSPRFAGGHSTSTPHFEGTLSVFTDMTERKQAEEAREQLIAELQEALAKVKTLGGLLPICASCKKIRDDQGYWHQVEVYVRDHSEADFSHGLCPDCARKLYPEFFKENG